MRVTTVIFSALLVAALLVSVQGALATRARIAATFDRLAVMRDAQTALERMLRAEVEEQNAVRGYAIGHDPFYRREYTDATRTFETADAHVLLARQAEHLDAGIAQLRQYDRSHEGWHRTVAAALFASPSRNVADLDRLTKRYSDIENARAETLRALLASRSRELGGSTQAQINRTLYVRAAWLLLFGIIAIVLHAYGMRVNRRLAEEQTTTQTLQRAFRSEFVSLPNCEIGSAYSSASSQVAIGGDVFDVYRLSPTLALVMIGDISGKGIAAAVLTAFVKFTMRGIALRRRDPGAMLFEFNTAFMEAVENPSLFVSMFVGVLDTERMILQYASAGHDSAFIRRSDGVQQLSVTGPVIGVMVEPYATNVAHLMDGDTLVLATDGLTDARDRTGEPLGDTRAMALIDRASAEPQLLADEVVAYVRALGARALRDDIAVLAITVHEPVSEAQSFS